MWGAGAATPQAPQSPQAPAAQPPAAQPGARHPGAAIAATATGATATAAATGAVTAPPARLPGTPQPSQPEARRPTTAQPQIRPVPTRPIETRVAQPGDRICSNCSEPNDPSRKFCRRCGTSLMTAPIQAEVRLPWYRRIFRREPKAAKTYAAGERTGSMQPKGKDKGAGRKLPEVGTMAKGALALLVGFGIIGAVVFPSIPQMIIGGGTGFVDDIRKMFAPTFAVVHPIGASATSEVEGHGAALVIDAAVNTDWQSTEATPTLTVTFQTPIDLGAVYVHSGTADNFVDLRRPARLEFVFPDGRAQTIDLVDDHKPQQFQVEANDVKSLQVKIVSTNGPDGAPVALSEIEFFMKK